MAPDATDPTPPTGGVRGDTRGDVPPPLRVPIAAAAERGVSWLAAAAADRRLVLTRFGRPTAVVDSAERLDELARQVRAARREVVALAADVAAGRLGAERRTTLEEACARLDLDPVRVRARARELAG
jgi:PHD/YefM family antitoxin component YafN of YafNO toxin-antitoxin module